MQYDLGGDIGGNDGVGQDTAELLCDGQGVYNGHLDGGGGYSGEDCGMEQSVSWDHSATVFVHVCLL